MKSGLRKRTTRRRKPTPNRPTNRKADAKTIYRKFQARTDIQADKTPLKDLVAQLSKRHGIPIRLDEPAFKKAGIALDVPVTASIKNFTLNAALQHVLKDLKLHHIVKDGVVLVTTGEEQAVPEEEVEAAEKPVAVPAPRVLEAVRRRWWKSWSTPRPTPRPWRRWKNNLRAASARPSQASFVSWPASASRPRSSWTASATFSKNIGRTW